MSDQDLMDIQREDWQRERIDAILKRLRDLERKHPDEFWAEIESVIAQIVMACAELDDMKWPADLHLGDLVEKHVIRFVDFGDEV